ncbi:MAG: hypothetical protein MJ003_03810 [Paludibacteraceae bacterium]|nr:hypothetical protein [Paludibacteraceae bacterium]
MKTKNLLNKKITQWLLLVAMLVGCSAHVYADPTWACVEAKSWNGSSNTQYHWGTSCLQGGSSLNGKDLGTLSGTFGIDMICYNNDKSTTYNNGQFGYQIGSTGSWNTPKLSRDGEYSGNAKYKYYLDIIGLNQSPGNYQINCYFRVPHTDDNWYIKNGSDNFYFKYTIPGYSTTTGTKECGSVNIGSSSDAFTISTTHYGSTTTATAKITGTNASEFSTSSVSATSFKVTFKPTSAGSKTATVTVTDAYSKTYTLTVTGTGVQPCTTPAKPTLTADANPVCANTAPTFKTTTESNVQYQLYKSDGSIQSAVITGDGTTKSITASNNISTATTYYVKATSTKDGCSSYTNQSENLTINVTPNASITSVSLDKYTAIVGETVQASAVVAATGGGTGKWSSNNTSVATINATSGVITTVTAGDATFTYSISDGCGSDSKTTSTLTVSEPACTQPTLGEKPSRDANTINTMSLKGRAYPNLGDCTVESWGLKAYTNSACTGEPVSTVVATTSLSTTKQSLQLTGLTANTQYYVKLYVVLEGGATLTSEATSWQTKVALETATTTNIVCDGATLNAGSKTGGNCTKTLTAARFRYATTEAGVASGIEAPTSVTSVGSPFSATLTGLTPNTTYYYRTEITYTSVGSGAEMQTNSPTYSFKTAAPSCTNGTVPSFANVVLGQSGTAQNATFTYCGYDNFTYELSGANAGDFQLGSGTASSGTITLLVTFKPTSAVGGKNATIIVKSNGTQVATMAISATALCITPTAADYNVTNNTYIYDGQSHTATITPRTDATYGKYPTGTAQYGGQANQKNVGNYTITYTVSAASGNYCATSSALTLNKTLDISCPTATAFIVTIDKTEFCDTETATISLSGSQTFFNYRLTKDGTASGDATTGTGSAMNFAGIGTSGTWGVQAEPNVTGCTSQAATQMTGTHAVTVNATPSLSLSGSSTAGATPAAATYPWEYMTITATAGAGSELTWNDLVAPAGVNYVYETGSADNVKQLKSEQTANPNTDKFVVSATATKSGCSTTKTYDVYINAAPAEVCQ